MPLHRLKSRNLSVYHHQEKLTSIINKKTIRYHLYKAISEFNILPKKLEPLTVLKHAMKALFWTIVYLTFIYLTITSTFEVVQRYYDDAVTTNMKAVINNNVTYLPNMTIRLKINTKKLFNMHSTSTFNYTSAWSRFFEENTLEGVFKFNESRVYDDEIYLSLLKYLAMIYEAERAWEPGLTQISTFRSEKSDDWIALKKILVPNIEHYSIAREQLTSIFGEKLCSLPADDPSSSRLLDFRYRLSKKTECVTGNKISFIGPDTICFRLIGYQNYLLQLGTTESILLLLYDYRKAQKWCQKYTIDLGSESRSTPRRATTRNETYAYYYNRFPGEINVAMDIGIKALHRKLPYVKGDIQCSSDTTREECENKCHRGWIRAHCHCSPITFNLTTDISSYRNCTVDDYSICLKKYTENATYLCTNKCVPLCEQWHYEYNLESKYSLSNSYVEISLRTFDYIIIEQVFSWTSFEGFIGALGGVLGIWLGLDFVIILEFIFKLVTKLIKKILVRNGQNSEEDKQRERVDIKHREENVENRSLSSNEIGSRVVGHQKKYKEYDSEEQRASRKKRESNAVKEEHVQQRIKRIRSIRVDSVILDNNMKNIDAHDGDLQNHKVNTTDIVDSIQDECTAYARNSRTRSWFLQNNTLLFLNGDASTNKPAVFLQFVEKLFWTAFYLGGSVFTALWCVDLINSYLADEAVYYLSLVKYETVLLPPPSLCILHDNFQYLERFSNISNALVDYFNQSDRVSFLQTSGGKSWPVPLISIGLFYFGAFAASEINSKNFNFVSEYEWQLNRATGENIQLRNDINKSLSEILVPKLLEWNVTANELRQKLGAELAHMVKLSINFTNSNGTIDIVKEVSFYTAAVTDDLFCYGLSYTVNFTDSDDVLEFSISKASYPQLFPSDFAYIIFSDFLLKPSSAESMSSANVAVFDSTYFAFTYWYVTRTLISVDGLYTSRPAANGVKHCSPNTTQSYCRAQCRIELIEKLCNCSPIYWTAMIRPISGLNECTLQHYMECSNFNASDHLDCKDTCLPFCTASYFQSDSRREISVENTDTAVARFSVKDGSYVLIEEQPTFTFSDLLNKLGGTLGILLGFSIFSFYRILVTTATLCVAFILKRTRLTQSPVLLKSLDKIRKSAIAQLISQLHRKLGVMNICNAKKNIEINKLWNNILLAIGYLIGLYATVRMCSELYYSFKTGEPKYQVDLMMNETIKLLSWTICMPLDTAELLSETEISNFENNIDLTKNLQFNSFYNKEELFSRHWPKWLIRWAYEYLIIYDTVERHGNQKLISALLADHDNYTSIESREATYNYSFTSLMELDEFIDHFNITIPELKQNLGQKIREIYKIKAFFVKEVDGAWNRTVLNITETTLIGEDKICYKLPVDTVTFSSKLDYVYVYLNRGLLPNRKRFNKEKPITIDFIGRDISKESNENFIFGSTQSFSYDYSVPVTLDITEIYEAMPVSSGVRQCSKTKSMDTCQDECQKKKIERVCNCSPATRSNFPSNTNLARCHLIDYKRCAKFLVNSEKDLCESSCVPHCTLISLKVKRNWDEQWIESNVAKINLTINSFDYISIKEVYKYTPTNFFSEFGGILGFWIGLDILAFIDLFYWLLCEGCHTFRQFL